MCGGVGDDHGVDIEGPECLLHRGGAATDVRGNLGGTVRVGVRDDDGHDLATSSRLQDEAAEQAGSHEGQPRGIARPALGETRHANGVVTT